MNKLEINIRHDIKKWDKFLSDLHFKCKSNFLSSNYNAEIQEHEFSCNSKLIVMDAPASIHSLKYEINEDNTFFIVNSLSPLEIINDTSKNYSITQNGSSFFIPANEKFHLKSVSRRKSVSLFMNKENVAAPDDFYILEQFMWKKTDSISTDLSLNSFINKLYYAQPDSLLERSFQVISNLISYEIEVIKKNPKKNEKSKFLLDLDMAINDSYKNQDFDLQKLAKKMGVSTRTIQYKLAQYDIKFHKHVQRKRANLLKILIDSQPHMNTEYLSMLSGFNSIETANRTFNNFFGCSITRYKQNVAKK